MMKKLWHALVKPPYRLVPWLVWIYVPLCCLALPYGGVFTGHLFGFDDQVRMTQVLNWINGAGFYDRTLMRANPPEGFTTIWTRLVDMPIALLVLVAQQFVAQKKAALVAAAIMPMAQLAFLMAFVAPYFARPLVGKNKARLICLFLVFTTVANYKFFSISGFMMGEASHHAWYVILYLLIFGATARLAMGSARIDPVLMLAGSVALCTAVGIECYPMIAGATGFLAVVGWGYNRPSIVSRGGDGLLIAALGAVILLPLHQPPQNWFSISFAEPSILGAMLVGIAGGFLKVEVLVLRKWGGGRVTSALVLGGIAACSAAALVYAFPDMLNGAAAGLSPAERKMALSEHYEALSLWAVSRNFLEFINLSMPIFIGLVAGVVAVCQAQSPRRKAVSFCYLGFAALGGGMCSLFSRYYHHALTTACPWLLWAWEKLKSYLRKNKNYSLCGLGLFIAICPFWLLLLPALEMNAPVTSQILFFPAALQTVIDPCESLPLATYLNAHYDKNTLLMEPSWLSAQLLYQLDMRIDFIANYPSHDKFIDNYAFYQTTDVTQARNIAARHGLDLVVTCMQNAPPSNLGIDDDGLPFNMRMQIGHVPGWLKPVTLPFSTPYRLYAIDKKQLEQLP